MKTKIIVAILGLLFCFGSVFGQNGGKAEPRRIEFAKGKSSATFGDRIKGDEQHEFIFSAREGQLINARIASLPKGKHATFVILHPTEEAKFFTKFFENYDYTFPAPYTGEYVIRVFLQPETTLKSARFNLTLRITKPKI